MMVLLVFIGMTIFIYCLISSVCLLLVLMVLTLGYRVYQVLRIAPYMSYLISVQMSKSYL